MSLGGGMLNDPMLIFSSYDRYVLRLKRGRKLATLNKRLKRGSWRNLGDVLLKLLNSPENSRKPLPCFNDQYLILSAHELYMN